MTREQWSQLDDDTKKIWSTIPEKFKAIILGKTMDTSSTRRHANVHQLHPDPEPDPIFLDDPEPDTTTPDTVEANKTQQQPSTAKYPPHDMSLVITNRLSTAASNSMQSCKNDTICSRFILSAKPFHFVSKLQIILLKL